MHPLAFKIKRVHHRILFYGRFLLRGIPHMTPARFDLLYALDWRHGELEQHELLEQLGIHPTTLSKMLKRLEQLGVVVRQKSLRDGRAKKINLTTFGQSIIRIAMRRVLRWGPLQVMFESFFRAGPGDCFLRVDALWSTMMLLSQHLRDTARLAYPTDHPDD